MKKYAERIMKYVFLAAACTAIIAVLMICIFLFGSGIPAIHKIGLMNFLGGRDWAPTDTPQAFGILPMIMGSFCVTGGAIIFGVPTGVLTAVYMAKYCPKRLYKILKPATELLAGIPSIVYGFFGLMLLVPIVRTFFGGSGSSILTASLVLGIMILPTIIGVAESALRSVPGSCYEGARALGADHERSVFCAVLPAAKSGILAGIVLGIGRAIGETMAVIMVAGNQARMPSGILKGIRTLTANIVMEMGYAAELHREALIATGVVLFVLILVINLLFALLQRGGRKS